jgi:type IV pilus assembly protein PilY1
MEMHMRFATIAPRRDSLQARLTPAATAVLVSLLLAVSASAVDLADTPMFTRILPPPANLMFVLDDSGSMNFEILVSGQFDGSFPDPANAVGTRGFCYVFDDVGDNVYKSWSVPGWYAAAEGRKLWRIQWSGANVMYYNPAVTYSPWPGYGAVSFSNADPNTPRSHPATGGDTLDLSAESFSVGGVTIPHARYIVYDAAAGRPYLVVLDAGSSSKRYYSFTVTGTGLAEKISALTAVGSLPAGVDSARSYAEERQNFANWFTYHRRREFVAKNALANVIRSLSGVKVGIYGINKRVVVPLSYVNVTQNFTVLDSTATLLQNLYAYYSSGGTPLKSGLKTVGQFYADNTGTLYNQTGLKPYPTAAEGGSCQQSFTIVLTDGYYDDLSTTLDGNTDGDNGVPYADTHSNALADIAMYYYENDLSPDAADSPPGSGLADQVPKSKYDRAAHQHMATYAIAFGVNGSLNPSDYNADLYHRSTGQPIQWTVPTTSYRPEAVDDLWHATVNGRGKFFNARNPVELTTAMTDLMAVIAEILISSSSSVTVNGDYLYGKVGSTTLIYQALYSSKDGEWTGDIKAFPINPTTGDVVTASPRWSAAQRLESLAYNQRRIATYNGSAGAPFTAGNLSAAQQAALGADYSDKVTYLRGGTVSGFRTRSQKLGDIVNSAPVFSDGVVYSGGNDGMLHAFDALTGDEIFAYVPNLIFDQLYRLTDPAYTHRFYVDLTPTIKKGAGVLGGTTPRSLLVGGLRNGGKGYFGLNVTDAKTIANENDVAARVLWEFPQTTDDDMGYSFSKPVVVRTNSTTYPWVVIFGNGYNSTNGNSVLYVIHPQTGALIRKIPAGTGPDNGLSSPMAVDTSHDERIDFVYAGDLKGNLWKFDLTNSDPSFWSVAFASGGVAQPLFRAQGPGGTAQPITVRPEVMYHPKSHGLMVCFGTGKYLGDADLSDTSVQSIYGLWDYGDKVYDQQAQQWTQDDDREFLGTFTSRSTAPRLSNQPAKVSLLQQRQAVFTVKTGGYEHRLRFLSTTQPVWTTMPDPDNASTQAPDPDSSINTHVGYFIDLDSGERVISDSIIRNGLLLAVGFTPNSDRCGPGGNSMFMEINAFTGGSAGSSLFDITGDLLIDSKDLARVDFNQDGTAEDIAPSGIELFGNVQPPAILRLPGSGDPMEKKYLSSSTGTIEQIHEKGPKLGVTYWMEIHY